MKFPQKSSYKSLQISVSFFSSAQLPLFLGAYRASLSKSDRILLRIIYQHDFPFENGVPLQVVFFALSVKLPDDNFYKRKRARLKSIVVFTAFETLLYFYLGKKMYLRGVNTTHSISYFRLNTKLRITQERKIKSWYFICLFIYQLSKSKISLGL